MTLHKTAAGSRITFVVEQCPSWCSTCGESRVFVQHFAGARSTNTGRLVSTRRCSVCEVTTDMWDYETGEPIKPTHSPHVIVGLLP